MKTKKESKGDFLIDVFARWDKQREEEALTMCAKRKPTEKEINRAMIIGKCFAEWNKDTGPCPIDISSGYWGKKLCSLFEWIAVLETEANKNLDKS